MATPSQLSLVQTVDENGKVQLRCELFQGEDRQFSTLVKTPLNQLFFCQQALPDGSQLLIGVGALTAGGLQMRFCCRPISRT